MNILITTGIYPPKVGGPSQYAKRLKQEFEEMNFSVCVRTFDVEEKLPTGIRHIYFFFKILPRMLWADKVITLDTWSVGLPTVVAGVICFREVFLRTGGDFLWEQYVERTKRKVLFRSFYLTEKPYFNIKEKVIFSLTKFTLRFAKKIIFSTIWQRDIFIGAYGLKEDKTKIIENFYGPKEADEEAIDKTFIASSRGVFLKNESALKEVFINIPEAKLFVEQIPFVKLMEKMKYSYAVIVPALSEISPNMILDAIRFNRPFICTREVGIYDRIKDAGFFVDPLDLGDIEKTVKYLLTDEGYNEAKKKVRNFSFVHTWKDIALEFENILKSI